MIDYSRDRCKQEHATMTNDDDAARTQNSWKSVLADDGRTKCKQHSKTQIQLSSIRELDSRHFLRKAITFFATP